jgi:hypothetical protein
MISKINQRTFVMCAAAFAALPALATTFPALALKRVTLSSSGVGYFEYEALVERDATLRLPVKLDQVNDVLKSLVVHDAKGQVGGVSLPGREPLGELLRALPFDAAALGSMPDLLQALRGAQILVQTPAGAVQGRIMAVTPFSEKSDKGMESQKHRASLMTATGLRHVVIEDAKAIQFQDEQLRAQIADALAAMSNNRAKDGRTLEIITRGSERRTVRVGFVASAPIWKTAYRLTVPSQDAAAGSMSHLQGWAVVENMSGQDWRGVELTLTTGKPVAFQQNLYDSVFNQRPNVPIEIPGRIVPRADTGAVLAQNFVAAPSYAPATSPMPAPMATAARAVRPAAAPAPAPAAMLSRFASAEASAPARGRFGQQPRPRHAGELSFPAACERGHRAQLIGANHRARFFSAAVGAIPAAGEQPVSFGSDGAAEQISQRFAAWCCHGI